MTKEVTISPHQGLSISLQQIWRTRGWNKFCPEVVVVEGPNNVSKCKNNKIFKKEF
jgi:hypothetical protein